MQVRTPHPGDIKGSPPFYLEAQNRNPRTNLCRRSLLRDGGVLCCRGLPGNASESSTNRQGPSCSSLCWRNGGIPDNEPPSHQGRLAWTANCTNTANGMESRENGTRLLELPGRRSWRRLTSTFNEELRRCCSPDIGGAGFLKTHQRTTGVGNIPRGAVVLGAERSPHNEATQEKQSYSSRAAFPQSNGVRLSSIDRHAENHIRIAGDQATSKLQPFKPPPVHTENEKAFVPLLPENFEYRGEDAHISALNRAICDSAGAEAALRRGEMPSRLFCINRRISPLAVPLSCGSEQSGSAFFQQKGSSCTQTSWESGANQVSKSCLPSTGSKQEGRGKATSAHRGTRAMHLLSTLESSRRSKLEWNHECRRQCSGDWTICGSEEPHISEHLYSERRQRGLSCLPPTQPEGSPIDGGLSPESYLPHLATAAAEPPVGRHLQVTESLSGGQIETKSEQGRRQDASAAASCTPSIASTCREYALATPPFSSGLPNCLSETDVHHTSPKERLFHEYCTKGSVTANGLERFRVSLQASGPTGGGALSPHEELQGCAFSSEEDEHGKKRGECICTNFPLDTLQEPLSHSSFRAVAVVAGEPAETPTTNTVKDNINSKSSSLRPLQDLQGPSLLPSSVVESYEPQPPGQRERTTSSSSSSSPHTTQRATVPRRNPQQDEEYHRKIGHPEGKQYSIEKDEKQQRQEAGDENSQRQRMYTTKQNQRGRMAKQKIEEQQQGSKVIDNQVNRPVQHQKEQEGRPLQLHGQRTKSPRHEEGKKQRLDEPEDNAANEDGICLEVLQQQRRQMQLLDFSASLGTGNRTSSCSPSPGQCKEPPEGIQSRLCSQHFEEDGEQHLQLQHMPEEWLEHEMQALLRQEYQQRQIVQRREEQQHEALQQHPPLERPWVLLAQKQQEEHLRQMHQATLQQMQRELINRHQKQLQARLEEEGRVRQEKLEKERQETIRFKQQQKQNQQKQLKSQKPTSGSKQRSVPFTRRKNIYRQHRIQERQDQPPEVPTAEEQDREEMQEKHQQREHQQGEELQMLDQQQQAQHHSPVDKDGEDDDDAQKHEDHQQLQQQQLEAHQQVETTDETDGAKTTQQKKQRDLLKNQLPTQRQLPAQQLQQHQQQHGAASHGEVRQPLHLGYINLTESSKQKVQQTLQKGCKPTYAQKGQQKHQLLTKQEGPQEQVPKGEKEQTNSRQPAAGERQKEQEDPKRKEDRSERNDKHRQKYKQMRHNLEEEPAQEERMSGTEIPQQQGAKTLPANGSPIQRLTQDEGIQNDEPENMGEERVPQAQQQLLSIEKHKAEQQHHQQGERENKKSKGQIQAENQNLRTQQNREHPKQRWMQQKEPHPVSKGSLPQTQVQGLDQQSQQRQQGKQQDIQQQQEQQHQEMYQWELQRERQGQHQEQQQRSNQNPESNSALTRSELLRLSFTPLAAVKESDYYLRHQPQSNTNASLACVPWGIATSTRHQSCSRMPLSDTNQQLVTTPRRRLYEGQRSGDSNVKAPMLASQQADNYRLSKGQQRLLNQRWAPLEITQKQTSDCKQAERGGLTKSLLRKRIPLLLPPPPPPVTETTQLTQRSPEHWKVAPMRGGHQPKNSRSRQRLLQQEQRRLQKQPTEPAVNFPLRAPESTRHRETHQNIERKSAPTQPDLQQQQQQQQLPVYKQEAHCDLAVPVSSKGSDKRSSRSTQRSADGPKSLNASAPGSRPTWAQKAVALPPERAVPKCKGLSTHKAAHVFVGPARGDVRADLGQRYNEHPTDKYHEEQDREGGGSGVGRTQQLHKMQSQTPRCELQVQRVHDQTEEQRQRDRLNPIVLQVHQQLAQARLEFLEERSRVQNRANRMHALREARQLEEQQQPSVEPPAVIQEERHHTSQHHHEHQQQQQHQQQEHGDNSVPHFSPPHHHQQPKTGPGQLQEHQGQQQKEQQQHEPQKEQQHPYGGQNGQQRGGHTEQQLQQEVRAPSFPVGNMHEPILTQVPCNGQHQPQQQQLQPVLEPMHDYGEHLSCLHRLHFQQQDVWGQQSARQPLQPLEMQQQQDQQQHTQQQGKQYWQERFHLTQQQQQQQQPPPQQPFIYGQQNTPLPQDPSPTTQQQHPLGQQHQQALLQLQPPLSLQQQQIAWLVMNQQRLWLPQQQHLWTPSQQILWAQQHHQFWQHQQQQLWQLHHPQAWLQQQDWWMQHQQLAYVQQQLLHQQEEEQQFRGPPSAQQRVDCFSPHVPAGVLSDIILGAAENAANNGYFISCGLRMPPPWDGCIPRENIRLGLCPVCLQYVRLDRCLLPFIATPVAPSPAAYTSDTAAAEYFYEPQSLLAEFSSREQRLPTASADAAGGPPGVSLLPETASRGADGAAEGNEGRCQQTNPTFPANDDNHGSHSMHDGTNSFNDIGRTYEEYPNSSEDTSGSDGVCNSSSGRTSRTTQTNRHMNRTSLEGGDTGSNNQGNNSAANHFARFEAFGPIEYLTESPRGYSGQTRSMVVPPTANNNAASILETTTTDTYQNQLSWPLQHQLHGGTRPSGGLVGGHRADSSNGSLSSFSSFNPSAPVFVPAYSGRPSTPTFAAAVAAAAAAADQESLTAGTLGNPAAATQPWNTQQTDTQRPMNSYGNAYPSVLRQQQSQQQRQELRQQHSQNQHDEQQRVVQAQLPQGNGQYSVDGHSNVQQLQQSNQFLHEFHQSYQRLSQQQYRQQQNEQQGNEEQHNEQQQLNQPHGQQWPQYSFPSSIAGSLSETVPSLDTSSRQGSLLVIGACLQCGQFIVRPPALCLLDQIRARGIGPEEAKSWQPVKYEE